MFAAGQAGFLFQGEWEITTFQTAKTPFSMTLFPNVFGGAIRRARPTRTRWSFPKQPTNDAKAFERSLGFIRSMLDQSDTWAEGGHVPAWLPYADSAAFKKLTPQSDYAAAADAAVYDPDGWYSGSGSNFEIIIGSAIGSVQSGQLTPEAALAQMRSKLSTLARPPRRSNRPARSCQRSGPAEPTWPFAPTGGPRSTEPRTSEPDSATAPTTTRQSTRAVRSSRRSSSSTCCSSSGPALYGLVMSFFNTSLVKPGCPASPASGTTPKRCRAATSGPRCGTPSGSRSSPRRR